MASKFHGYLWPVSLLELDDALFIRGRAYRIHRHHRSDALSMGGIHASTTLRHQVLRGIHLSRRYRFDFYIRIHDPRTASIHSFASVRAAPPRRSNKFDRGAFRFLHSMIDRSIDRSSFSSIFKSNYFFFL